MRKPNLSRRRLFVESLEVRDVPAGTITAKLSAGVLTLVGDNVSNAVTIKINTGVDVLLTPDATTTIDNLDDPAAPVVNTPVAINGTVNSIIFDAKNGDDTISIDGGTDFIAPGVVDLRMGDGNNGVFFNTTQKIDLGSLKVKSGAGGDFISVQGGVGMSSEVDGIAAIDTGFGSTNVTLSEIDFLGLSGLSVKDARSSLVGMFNATNVDVTGPVRFSIGQQTFAAFNTCTLGSLTGSGDGIQLTLTDCTVNGAVSTNARFASTVQITGTGTTTIGDLKSLGLITTTFTQVPSATFQADNITLRSNTTSSFVPMGVATVGNLTLIAGSVAQLATGAANFQADDILLRSNMQSSFTAGGPVNVGNVAIIGPLGATLTSAAANFVSGNIFLKSISASAFNVTGAATVGNILIGGNFTSQLSTGTGNFTAGNITINGQFQSTLNAFSPSFTAGNITFNGQFQSTLNSTAPNFTAGNVAINTGTISSLAMTSGTMSVGRLTLAALASQVNIGGNSLTINGDLKVLGKLQTMVSFNTTALSEIKGNALVAGGSFLNNFSTNEFFEAEKDLLLLFGNGGSLVTIGNGVGTVPILGKLIVRTGRGDDFINLQRVDVTGATSISTGFGADNLAIDDGAEFNSTFTANMGAGNDNIFIAQAIGSFQAVSFAGLTTINAGAGNDTLLLGANPGDANSTADFAAGFAHKIIGGLGINTFDGLTGGIPPISPAKYTGLTAANFLSWTDPNP